MNTTRSPIVVAIALPLVLAWTGQSQTACSAAAFGPTSQDPITISGAWTIGGNCTLNFGFRHVIFDPGAALTVTNVTILAGQITIAAGASIASSTGAPGSLTLATTPSPTANGSVQIAGTLDFISTPTGGSITINSGASVSIGGPAGRLAVSGIAAGDLGGAIDIIAIGNITLDGGSPSLDAHGFDAEGGTVSLQSVAGSIVVVKSIDASGLWEGGQVVLSASTTLTTWGEINASASTVLAQPPTPGHAGTITASAGSFIDAHGDFHAAIGGWLAFGFGGSVVLVSGGGIDVYGTVDVQGGVDYDSSTTDGGSFVASSVTNYRQLAGGVIASSRHLQGSGGVISIQSGGSVEMHGYHEAGYSYAPESPGGFGSIEVHGHGDVTVTGPLMNQGHGYGWPVFPNAVAISSDAGNITMSGSIAIQSTGGGVVDIAAGRNVLLGGTMVGSTVLSSGSSWQVSLSAVQDLTLNGILMFNQMAGTLLNLSACRVMLSSSSTVFLDSWNAPSALVISAGDLLSLHGVVTAVAGGSPGTDGSVQLRTRLGAPHAPILTGSTINPAPTIIHDSSLPPCLANGLASLTGGSPLTPGDTFVVNLESVPSKPVLVFASLSIQHLSLGALGWTQVNPFPSNGAVLADPGVLGPAIAGSSTDSSGHWATAISTVGIPGLAGLTVYVEAYVIDPAAANGAFHQPPYVAIQFL